jgi:hypothetical protein
MPVPNQTALALIISFLKLAVLVLTWFRGRHKVREEIAFLQGHSNIVQYFKNAMAAGQKENERITLLTQERRGSKQDQSVMDLGTLEGDPNAVIVSPFNDAV